MTFSQVILNTSTVSRAIFGRAKVVRTPSRVALSITTLRTVALSIVILNRTTPRRVPFILATLSRVTLSMQQ